jgi:hypothetical protein
MVWTLQFPDKPIPVLIQDLLYNHWPQTADIDPNKLQTTRDQIDWAHDFEDQSRFRATIKSISLEADTTKSVSEFNRRVKRQEMGGTVVVRVQYRDVQDEQPRELWNIGKEIQNLVFRYMFDLVSEGIHDIKPGKFLVRYKLPDHPEMHEWQQNVFAFFMTAGIET